MEPDTVVVGRDAGYASPDPSVPLTIPDQIERTVRRYEELDALLDRLFIKLEPVLVPLDPDGGELGVAELVRPAGSLVASDLDNLEGRLQRLSSRVAAVTDRVNL